MKSCPPPEKLIALWSGELDDAESAAMDQHLFSCDSCAEASQRVGQVVGALNRKLPFVISHSHRQRLTLSGTRIQVTNVDPTPDRVPRTSARFDEDIDVLVFALRGDVSSADRVDVEIAAPTGAPRYMMQDVPFDRKRGEILIACQRHYEDLFASGDPIFTVHAIEAGQLRTVGDYVVEHVWR